jgi:hypothetical protein
MPLFFALDLTKQNIFYCIYMIVLQNTSDNQTFNFIPRSYTQGTTYTIKITNETTNTEVYNQTSTSFVSVDYYYQHSDTFSLVEDTMYNIEITAGSELIFRDKIFCTNQTVATYSVNNNAYTENSDDNDFIVL